jgi:predicted Zn-dependent protease
MGMGRHDTPAGRDCGLRYHAGNFLLRTPMLPPLRFLLLALPLAAIVLPGCAQNPATGRMDFVLVNAQTEARLGDRAHDEVLRHYTLSGDAAIGSYVASVGRRVAAVSEQPQLDWRFFVLDTPKVNAFAVPGGRVYVTRGMLAMLASEAELAAVLAHEIAHGVARHGVQRQSRAAVMGLGVLAGAILVPGVGAAVGTYALASSAGAVWLQDYSREQELEADRLAVRYLAASGYAPQAMAGVVNMAMQLEVYARDRDRHLGKPEAVRPALLASHPALSARLEQAGLFAAQTGVRAGTRAQAPYLAAIDGLIYGDSPAQGVIREDVFYHPELGVVVQFPPGWGVENGTTRTVATAPGGEVVFVLGVAAATDSLDATVRDKLELDADYETRATRYDGYPALYATGSHQGRPLEAVIIDQGKQHVMLVGMARDRTQFGRHAAILRASLESFRAFRPADTGIARPWRVHATVVTDGVRYATLAMRSPLGEHAEAQLRVMNRAYPTGEPVVGRPLKEVK